MEHEVFILSLHFFPGHLSGWPLKVIFVKHNKCIPLRYAAEGPSLKVSSHNCEVLIRQLPNSLPLFPACIFFFFYSIPGIQNVIYLSFVSIQLKTEHLSWVVTLCLAMPFHYLSPSGLAWERAKPTSPASILFSSFRRKLSPMGNGNPPL